MSARKKAAMRAAKKITTEPPTASPPSQPTFTLKDFHQVFGMNYACGGDADVDALDVALDVIDDLRRSIDLVNACLFETLDIHDSPVGEMHAVLTNMYFRAGAAIQVLNTARLQTRRPARQAGGAR